ncbi:unnamed protein product, partial [Oppiella nova]
MECNRGKVVSCPSDQMSYTNRVVVNKADYPLYDKNRNVEITTSRNQKYVFTLEAIDAMARGTMGFNMPMRKWAELSINEVIDVRLYTFNPNTQFVSKITLSVDYMQKTAPNSESYDTDVMAREFSMQFPRQAFTVGQTYLKFYFYYYPNTDIQYVFKFIDKKLLKLVVKDMEVLTLDGMKGKAPKEPQKTRIGQLLPDSQVVFEKSEESSIILTGQAKGK